MMEENIVKYINLYSAYLNDHKSYDMYPDLADPVQYILSLPAKHLRPASMLLAHHEFANSLEEDIFILAHAIEIFHNFTLMHDDIMDKAALRRGKKSTHLKYGENASILSGDAMMLLSIKEILSTNFQNKQEILSFFMDIGIQICEGQAMDMAFENRDEVSISEYTEMIRLKTSVLFGACLYLGSLVGGATKKEAKCLYNFGEKLGVAFQIQDDLLDAYGKQEKVGKRRAGDIYNKKKTFLYLEALKRAGEKDREELLYLYTSNKDLSINDVDRVLEIFRFYDIEQRTKSYIDEKSQEAISSLENLSISLESKERFLALSRLLTQRDY